METASIAELLAENRAQLSDLAEDQGLGQDVLTRFWTVGQDDLNGCVAYLKAQTTIVNPMTGTRWARTGTWYAGEVHYRPGNANPLVASGAAGLVWLLYQTLSKGDKIITINESCAAYTKTKIIHTYNPAIPSGTAVKGQIITVEATPTELGRERTEQETTIPKDQTETSAEDSAAQSVSRVLHTEAASPLGAPTATAGEIKRNENTPTPSGNTKTVAEVVTVKDQTEISSEDSAARSVARTLHTEGTTLGTASATAGTIKHNENAPTEAGKVRTIEEVVTVKDQTTISAEDSAARSVSRELHTEAAAPLGTPTAAAGEIKRNENQPTEAGKTRTVAETVTVKDQTKTSYEQNAFESADVHRHTENASALPDPTPAAGYVKRNENLSTEAGKTRTTEEIRAAVAQTVGPFASFISDEASGTIEKGHHAVTMPVITPVSGAEVTLDGDMDEFQMFGYVKRVVTSNVPLSCPAPVSWTTRGRMFWISSSSRQVNPVVVYDYTWISSAGWYQWAELHTLSFHLTAALAAAAIAPSSATEATEGSGISKVGSNLWQAHKIVHTLVAQTVYSFAKPEFEQTGVVVIPKEE